MVEGGRDVFSEEYRRDVFARNLGDLPANMLEMMISFRESWVNYAKDWPDQAKADFNLDERQVALFEDQLKVLRNEYRRRGSGALHTDG